MFKEEYAAQKSKKSLPQKNNFLYLKPVLNENVIIRTVTKARLQHSKSWIFYHTSMESLGSKTIPPLL